MAFAIHRREGWTDLPSLAAATAQRETTVRAGLDWLAARGDITCQFSGANQVQIAGDGEADTAAGQAAMRRVVILLDETAAYRAYYRRADANWLLSHAAPDALKSKR